MAKSQTVYNENREGDVMLYGLVEDLKKYMKEQAITYNELARKTNGEVSNATVSRILSHKTYPGFGTLYELYKAVGLQLHFHVEEVVSPEEEK